MLLILNSQSFFVEEYDTAFPEIQKKVWKKINAFQPIGNQGYSEILEKETNCAKNPQKKGLKFWKDSSKKLHYKNQSSKYENNLKGIWNVIKEIIVKKKLISPISGKLIVDNKEITDTVFTLISAPDTY